MPSTDTPLSDDVPAYIDTTKPSIARVYDAFLSGKNNYEVDREVFRRVQQVVPEATLLARDNRESLIRVTRFIAGQAGITQFLDLNSPMGSGWFRTRAEIETMFPGLEMIDPGLARCVDWWPDGPRIKPLAPVQHCLVGAVGRKP